MTIGAQGARATGLGNDLAAAFEAMESRVMLDGSIQPAALGHEPAAVVVDSPAVGDAADAWKFGTFGGRKNVKLTTNDSHGTPVTFTLTGGGFGEIVGGANLTKIVLTGTTATSVLTISASDAAIGTIIASGPLKSVVGKNIDLVGGAQFSGGVLSITLDDTSGDQGIIIGKHANAAAKVTLTFDRVQNLSIASDMPIKTVTATEWRDTGGAWDSISAPTLDTLNIKGNKKLGISGNFEASLALGDVLQPARINDSGAVAGSYLGLNLEPQAFVIVDGHLRELGTLGGPHSMAIGMNNGGLVVGQADTAGIARGQAIGHAFLWNGTTMIDLGTLGGDNSTAFDVNGSGWVVGEAEIGTTDARTNPISHAFLYRNGAMIDLGTLGGTNSEATAINNNGVVVGRTQTLVINGQTYSYPSHAFIWANGTMSELPTLGGPQSWAVDINDEDLAVGWADTGEKVDGDDTSHAVLWRNGVVQDLGTLGGRQSAAFAVNNNGQVVGWSETGRLDFTGKPILHAFLWHEGEMTDLGVELIGDDQALAYISIDNNGVIVGYTPEGAFRHENGHTSALNIQRNGKAIIQPLKSAKVAGSVGYSRWLLAGSAGSVSVGGMADTWRLYATDSIKSVKVSLGEDSAVAAGGKIGSINTMSWTAGRFKAGTIGSLKCTGNVKAGIAGDMTGELKAASGVGAVTVAGNASGAWDAAAIKSVSVRGSMDDMVLRLRQEPVGKTMALGKLTVGGRLSDTNVLSAGSIGPVTAKGVHDTAILAGVNSQGSFDQNSDGVADLLAPGALNAAATIKSVKIGRASGPSYSVENTNIAAGVVGAVTLCDAKFDNGGKAFGVSGGKVTRISYADSATRFTWPNSNVGVPQNGDFVLWVV